LVDEWYLSDLSENITASLTTKRKNAEFIGSWAPYGYRKDPNNKNSLIIDPLAAHIVKKIFNLYKNGIGINKIVQILNKDQVPNPLFYKQINGEKINPNPEKKTPKRYLWSPSTVSSILHNQTYIGHLVQGKFKKANYKSKRLLRVPKEDWIIIPGSHEPIINIATWDSVQKILDSKSRISAFKPYRHLFSGKIFCGECGSRLVSSGGRSGQNTASYFVCSAHNISKEACIGSRIRSDKLEEIILQQMNQYNSRYMDPDWLGELLPSQLHWAQQKEEQLVLELDALESEKEMLKRKLDLIYSDKLDGLITSDQYLSFHSKLKDQYQTAESRSCEILILLADSSQPEPDVKQPAEPIDSDHFFDCLTRRMIEELIDSIYIYKRKKGEPQKIDIHWDF